jgi:hypothetical protein
MSAARKQSEQGPKAASPRDCAETDIRDCELRHVANEAEA